MTQEVISHQSQCKAYKRFIQQIILNML